MEEDDTQADQGIVHMHAVNPMAPTIPHICMFVNTIHNDYIIINSIHYDDYNAL